jgi:hypothetical protein
MQQKNTANSIFLHLKINRPMKCKRIVSTLLYILCALFVSGQSSINIIKPLSERATDAYGYLVGQECYLQKIKTKYPDLQSKITLAQFSFDKTFGKSKENLRNYFKKNLGEKEFNELEMKVLTGMRKSISNQTLNEEIALNFITEVENRAKGQIASPYLETILSFQFLDKPEDEFLKGFTNKFKTKGHIKAKGTDWQINVPKSWKAEEGDRPNIIQKFTNENCKCRQSITLMVKEMSLPKGYKITKEELNDFFTEKEMKTSIPPGGKFIAFKKMTFDANIGGMLEIEQTVKRLDTTVKAREIIYMFIRDNKQYILSITMGSEKLDTDLTIEMQKYLSLYKLIANSIVVNDQYL